MNQDPPTTHWDLLANAARGDSAARTVFMEQYSPFITLVIRSSLTKFQLPNQDLSDLVQDVFLECFKVDGVLERARPGAGAGFAAFLRGVCKNMVLRTLENRYANRERQYETAELHAAQRTKNSEGDALDRAWLEGIVQFAAWRMKNSEDPKRVRQVGLIVKRYILKQDPKAIAMAEGISYEQIIEEFREARAAFQAEIYDVLRWMHQGDQAKIDADFEQLKAFKL